MATSNDLRKGMVLDIDGTLFSVVEFLHVKPGKGAAFVRSKIRDVLTGRVLDKTWRAGERVEEVRLERRVYQLLYHSDDEHVVMDPRSFEQISLTRALVGDAAKYLTDNCEVELLFVGETPIVVESPSFVNLAIVETDPGLRGDTASGGTKPAVLETGLVVQVPLFVKEGETIRVDTRTDTYLERVNARS